MVRKSKQEAMKTRQDILRAAISVFLKKGVAKATVHEIADEANLTRGAVYWHFDDKDDLVTAVFEEAVNVVIGTTEATIESDETHSLKKLKAFLCSPIQQLFVSQSSRDICKVLMHFCDHGDDAAKGYRIIFRAEGYYEVQLKHLINKAIDDGHLRSDLDIDATIFLLMSSVHGFTYRWLMPANPISFDLEKHLDTLFDTILLGLQYPKSNVMPISASNRFTGSRS